MSRVESSSLKIVAKPKCSNFNARRSCLFFNLILKHLRRELPMTRAYKSHVKEKNLISIAKAK